MQLAPPGWLAQSAVGIYRHFDVESYAWSALSQVDKMSIQSLVDQQGYCQHKFHYYRNGIPGYRATFREIDDGVRAHDPVYLQRWADITQRIASLPGMPGGVIPPAASFNFTAANRDRLRNVALPGRRAFRNLQAPLGAAPLVREARQAVKVEYTNAYKLMRSSFRYIKCLGWGGDGIASLWRYSPGPGQEHSVVMKMATQWEFVAPNSRKTRVTTEYIDDERDVITQLGRAPHIVQRFYTAHHPRASNPNSRQSLRKAASVANMAQKIDGHDGSYFLMEYCKFGNLESQLFKAARDMPGGTERYPPESVLWRIFDCLVKACMAMEEPPRLNPANGAVPVSTQGGHLPEVLTAGNPGREGIVHIDLIYVHALSTDPVIVFVYGYDPPAVPPAVPPAAPPAAPPAVPLVPPHTSLPRVQIGDFGYAQNEDSLWAHARPPALGPGPPNTVAQWTRREERWRLRHSGKLLYSLPEQFGKDWDRIPRCQDPSDGQQLHWMLPWMPPWMLPWVPPPPITTGPGRFSSASNVWQMGMIMKVCMMLVDPDLPPYAGRMTSQEPANPMPHQERWTYGWSLLDPTEPWVTMYQQSLIDLVARCLMAKQEHRPTLQQIQTIITQELALPANQNVPAYWTNTFFLDPQPPRPPVDTENVNDIDPFWDYKEREPV